MPDFMHPAICIVDALTHARDAYDAAVFSGSRLDPARQERTRRYLQDPFWRPLCELGVNGATSFEGTMLLLAAQFIDTSSFQVRRGPAIGMSVQSVDFTPSGREQLDYYLADHIDGDLPEELINALRAYCVIDTGSGIAARRCAIEGAIEYRDGDFLRRIKSIPYQTPQFSASDVTGTITLDERAAYLAYVTQWDLPRTGAQIIDLSDARSKA